MKQLLAVLILTFTFYIALSAAAPGAGATLPLERAVDQLIACVHLP